MLVSILAIVVPSVTVIITTWITQRQIKVVHKLVDSNHTDSPDRKPDAD